VALAAEPNEIIIGMDSWVFASSSAFGNNMVSVKVACVSTNGACRQWFNLRAVNSYCVIIDCNIITCLVAFVKRFILRYCTGSPASCNWIKGGVSQMIQCRLRELIAVKSRQSRRKITYDDVKESTGLSKTTLVKLANDKSALVSTNTLDKLCWYFECQPGDLLVYVPNHES